MGLSLQSPGQGAVYDLRDPARAIFEMKQQPLGGNEMAETKVSVPKKGDHVGTTQHEGVFEVVFVNALMQSANVRLVDGSGHVIPNVAWTALKALDRK
jgi:hypothetical protein